MILALAGAPGTEARGLQGWAVYGGISDTKNDADPKELGLELRFAGLALPKLPASIALQPAVGLAGTEDGNAWIYGGLRLDLELGNWVVTPQFAAALYEEGDGKDLGGVLQFRSGLEIAHRLGAGIRIGVLFYHLSNGGVYDHNPGSNSLVLTLSFGR